MFATDLKGGRMEKRKGRERDEAARGEGDGRTPWTSVRRTGRRPQRVLRVATERFRRRPPSERQGRG